jgi:hypothetical protein
VLSKRETDARVFEIENAVVFANKHIAIVYGGKQKFGETVIEKQNRKNEKLLKSKKKRCGSVPQNEQRAIRRGDIDAIGRERGKCVC